MDARCHSGLQVVAPSVEDDVEHGPVQARLALC